MERMAGIEEVSQLVDKRLQSDERFADPHTRFANTISDPKTRAGPNCTSPP
jgi:hypothetical protein